MTSIPHSAAIVIISIACYPLLRCLCSPLVARWLCLLTCFALLFTTLLGSFLFGETFDPQNIHRSRDSLKTSIYSLLIVTNLAVLPILYGLDKLLAKRKLTRIPEAVLHIPAFLGAAPGAFFSQRLFRHKTQKKAFQLVFTISAISSFGIYYLLFSSIIF